MKAHYDEEATDALIAASLRPLKQEPTDQETEKIYSDGTGLSEEDKFVFNSARRKLLEFFSDSQPEGVESATELEELKYAAMNRENADNEFESDIQDAIEAARKKALDELEERTNEKDSEPEGEDD